MAQATSGTAPGPTSRTRMGRDARRDALLDAATRIAEEESLDEVTIEAVAERAGVSRPLLYKHFANRDELLAALYRREAENLHRALGREVAAATDVESMFEALIAGALRASAERGAMFAALRSAGGWTREVRREQRERDVSTSQAFAAMARREGMATREARAAVSMLLALVDPVVVQWRAKPTPERAALLQETYMTIVRSSLASLRSS